MTSHDDMEGIWGTPAIYAEHCVYDHIRYCIEGQTRTGSIIWIGAPDERDGQFYPIRYIVRPDGEPYATDVIYPSALLIKQTPGREQQPSYDMHDLQQTLIESLAALSTPVLVKEEVDDYGTPFYVWQIGASTPQEPFGMYVGISRHLKDALTIALERLIRHMVEQPKE